MRRFLGIAALLAILGGGAALFVARAPGPLPQDRAVVIHHGNSQAVARSLQTGGILAEDRAHALAFRALAYLTQKRGQLHAAELTFPAHASMLEALEILRHAQPVRHKLTIPEGLTATQITALLADAPFLEGPVPPFSDGSLLPQTIDYTYATPRAKILRQLQDMMRQTLEQVWHGRIPDPAIQDPQSLVILASLVERESANPADRPIIARVFLNRLHAGMRLQSDPTVIYALTGGARTGGTITRPDDTQSSLSHADLSVASPFNTYAVAGLPPGPICAPGLSALEATAHPAIGAALYFVADAQGTTHFAATLGDHNRNVAAGRSGGR